MSFSESLRSFGRDLGCLAIVCVLIITAIVALYWFERLTLWSEHKRPVRDEFAEFCQANAAEPALDHMPKGDVLTIDFERSLIGTTKPVAFRGELIDVFTDASGATVAHFRAEYAGHSIQAFLKCTPEQSKVLRDSYMTDPLRSDPLKSLKAKTHYLIAANFDHLEREAPDAGLKVGWDYKYKITGAAVVAKLSTGEETLF